MSKKGDKKTYQEFKIITIGETGVGKTSIIKRYVDQTFQEGIMSTLSTVGISTFKKNITLKSGIKITLNLVDTCGQEKYRSIAKSYFRNVDGVLFVFSLYERDTFQNMTEWINLFNQNNEDKKDIPKYLIGNKSDLEHMINDDEIQEFCNKYDELDYVETSAKHNTEIDELFQELGEKLYEIEEKNPQTKQYIKLMTKKKKRSCCSNEDLY